MLNLFIKTDDARSDRVSTRSGALHVPWRSDGKRLGTSPGHLVDATNWRLGPYHARLFGLYWAADCLPGVEAATQGVRFGKALVAKLLCHTGTAAFARSSSVDESAPIFGPSGVEAR